MKTFVSTRIIATVAAILFLIGCIGTGTFVATVSLITPDEPVTISDEDYSQGEIEVNLAGDRDFKDNQSKIKNIDNVGFYLSVTNNKAFPVEFQILLESDTSRNYTSAQGAVDTATALVLTGLTIPAGQKVIVDWNKSMQYMTGVGDIKEIVKTGSFGLYPAVIPRGDFSVTVDSLVIIVTATYKL